MSHTTFYICFSGTGVNQDISVEPETRTCTRRPMLNANDDRGRGEGQTIQSTGASSYLLSSFSIGI